MMSEQEFKSEKDKVPADSSSVPSDLLPKVPEDLDSLRIPKTEEHGKNKRIKKSVLPPTLPTCVILFSRHVITATVKTTYWIMRTTWDYLRHYPNHAAFNLLLVSIIALLIMTGSNIHDRVVLSGISDTTIDKIIDASKWTRDYRSTETSSRGVQMFLRVGAPEWTQRESIRAVLYHSRLAGLSILHQSVLLATVEVESGFNPMARAPTTTACGLFQFVRATGETFGLTQAECMDPWKNAAAGVAHYIKNYKDRVEKKAAGLHGAERLFYTFERTYYLHHDGPHSSNPSAEVKAVVLNGTQFLFRSYEILLEDVLTQEAESQAPSFMSEFANNFWDAVGRLKNALRGTGSMLVQTLDPIEAPPEQEVELDFHGPFLPEDMPKYYEEKPPEKTPDSSTTQVQAVTEEGSSSRAYYKVGRRSTKKN